MEMPETDHGRMSARGKVHGLEHVVVANLRDSGMWICSAFCFCIYVELTSQDCAHTSVLSSFILRVDSKRMQQPPYSNEYVAIETRPKDEEKRD